MSSSNKKKAIGNLGDPVATTHATAISPNGDLTMPGWLQLRCDETIIQHYLHLLAAKDVAQELELESLRHLTAANRRQEAEIARLSGVQAEAETTVAELRQQITEFKRERRTTAGQMDGTNSGPGSPPAGPERSAGQTIEIIGIVDRVVSSRQEVHLILEADGQRQATINEPGLYKRLAACSAGDGVWLRCTSRRVVDAAPTRIRPPEGLKRFVRGTVVARGGGLWIDIGEPFGAVVLPNAIVQAESLTEGDKAAALIIRQTHRKSNDIRWRVSRALRWQKGLSRRQLEGD